MVTHGYNTTTPGMATHTCDTSTQEAEEEGQIVKVILTYKANLRSEAQETLS